MCKLTEEQIEDLRLFQNKVSKNRNDIIRYMKDKGYGTTYKECSATYSQLRKEGKMQTFELLEGEEFRHYHWNYYVSNKGRVMSIVDGVQRLVAASYTSDGYRLSKMYNKGKRISFRVHRAVALLFIPNPDNKPQVDHIDTNRSNNNVENLRWVTNVENMNNELTKIHASIATRMVLNFNIDVINKDTGELAKFNSLVSLYKYLGIDYIPKSIGTQYYKNYVITMSGLDPIEYHIGKWLRQGKTKEKLIDIILNYDEDQLLKY